MTKAISAHIALLIAAAEAGVDYSPRTGATCPGCGHRAKPYRTMPWEDTIRVRYHRCHHPGCLLAAIRQTIKSVEIDPAA
ncbi:MAG: transcriptional regulator [Bacteroidia bacterium]|nr:transcriptional regulator [Bacteroidia bacterium]